MRYDLIVVGGGAAGLLAAGHVAESGAKVLILEKMVKCGRKLRITGKGRCNITNSASLREFLAHIEPNPKFLYPAFKRFFNTDMIEFIENTLNIPTKMERGGRYFPQSDKAQDIVDALFYWNLDNKVKILNETVVSDLLIHDDKLVGVIDSEGNHHYSNNVIMSTGGASYPLTGTDGSSYGILERQGHAVTPILPSLIPLNTVEKDVNEVMGVSLKNVSASIYVDGKKKHSEFGEMLFAHFGLTGPIILTLSRYVSRYLSQGKQVEVSIDFKPALDDEKMKARLIRELEDKNKRQFESVLRTLFPGKVVPFCAKRIAVPLKKPVSQITAKERTRLHRFCKDLRFNIKSTRAIEEAIITAGGVNLKEVQQSTMESKLIPGLYIVGELLDLDADTGGFNLQIAWSTAWLAADSIIEKLNK